MIGLGIDSGSTTTKGVLVEDGKLLDYLLVPTTARPKESMEQVNQRLYSPEVGVTVATGYGRKLLTQADKQVTEITCHARGAAFLCPGTGVVIDIGGQDCKAILLDPDAKVKDFLMNDKCAAGTGRFMEVMMRTLGQDLDRVDAFVEGAEPVPITSMCTVFAESEMVSLLAEGKRPGDIALGVIHSICRRTAFFAQKMKLAGPVFFTGGLANFRIFPATLETYFHCPVRTHPLAQYAGAIGAAILAEDLGRKQEQQGM